MLRKFRQKVQWREDLIVALRACLHAVSGGLREAPARALLGLVDHLARLGHLHQPRQTERAAGHVLDQTLDSCLVTRWQQYRLIDAEPSVFPRTHVLHHFRFDLVLRQIQVEDRFLPGRFQTFQVELLQFQEVSGRGKLPCRT